MQLIQGSPHDRPDMQHYGELLIQDGAEDTLVRNWLMKGSLVHVTDKMINELLKFEGVKTTRYNEKIAGRKSRLMSLIMHVFPGMDDQWDVMLQRLLLTQSRRATRHSSILREVMDELCQDPNDAKKFDDLKQQIQKDNEVEEIKKRFGVTEVGRPRTKVTPPSFKTAKCTSTRLMR